MTDDRSQQKDQGLSSLSVDPDLLARELAAEDDVDPLDAIQLDDAEQNSSLEIARACDQGLVLLRGNHGERLQGLQVFCEHRDPRSIALLLPLLQNSCPVERMSAVYALGRNPSPPAVEPLLQLLQEALATADSDELPRDRGRMLGLHIRGVSLEVRLRVVCIELLCRFIFGRWLKTQLGHKVSDAPSAEGPAA